LIWIVGQNGMLGMELRLALSAASVVWIGSDRDVDITDPLALDAFAQGKRIDTVVNCAAYTAVDRAEEEPVLCRRLNVDGPANLARWADANGAILVHISTDYVFSGLANEPYTENDAVGPQGVYGTTKADGEAIIRLLCPRHFILRTAWLYGAAGPNFVFTMLRLMNQRESVGVVADQWGAPTWARDLCDVIVQIAQHREGPWGTYHVSGEGRCSWFQFAEAILQEAKLRGLVPPTKAVTVNKLTTEQYPTKAPRPRWSVLSKGKLKHTFNVSFPAWEDSLKRFLASLPPEF